MSTLSLLPPPFEISQEELKKWGYIWRVGTKKRAVKKKKAEVSDDTPEEDILALDLDGENGSEGDEADVTPVSALDIVTPEALAVPPEVLKEFAPDKKYHSAFNKKQGMDFGLLFDKAFGKALATMLGEISEVEFKGSKKGTALAPKKPNCVEIGPARIIGGIRPQNFDVAYRPDGVRVAYDSKTLNDTKSIQKNWQNMINDLGTEATTVHTRFPYAVVAFLVAVPKPALKLNQQADIIRTLERLGTRRSVIDQNHLAEAISFVVWDPETGMIDPDIPDPKSHLRIEQLMLRVHTAYVERYKGLPPHDK